MKVLWFDTETTGLDPVKQDVIQIAGIVEIDGEVKEEFNIKCQPINYETISQEALEVHGISVEQLKTFQSSMEGKNEIIRIFDKYIDKYDKNDKFTPAGQNVQFDVNMLREWFVKNGERFGSGSYHNYHMIDTVTLARTMSYEKVFQLENHKLITLANRYSIEIDAHDALSDIRATRAVYKSLINEFTIFCKNK